MVKIFQTYNIYLVQNIPKYRGFPIPKCRDGNVVFINNRGYKKLRFSIKNVISNSKHVSFKTKKIGINLND